MMTEATVQYDTTHTRRLYYYCRGFHWEYHWVVRDYLNEYFNNEAWRCEETRSVFVRFNPKLWEWDNFYYDGMTFKSVTLLGICIGHNNTYSAKPLKQWEKQ